MTFLFGHPTGIRDKHGPMIIQAIHRGQQVQVTFVAGHSITGMPRFASETPRLHGLEHIIRTNDGKDYLIDISNIEEVEIL